MCQWLFQSTTIKNSTKKIHEARRRYGLETFTFSAKVWVCVRVWVSFFFSFHFIFRSRYVWTVNYPKLLFTTQTHIQPTTHIHLLRAWFCVQAVKKKRAREKHNLSCPSKMVSNKNNNIKSSKREKKTNKTPHKKKYLVFFGYQVVPLLKCVLEIKITIIYLDFIKKNLKFPQWTVSPNAKCVFLAALNKCSMNRKRK